MDLFYALAEPRRRKIIEILASNGQLSATEICKKFDITAQAVSQHLGILRDARLVLMQKHAQQHIYRINPASMLELEEYARQTLKLWNERLDVLDTILKEEKTRMRKKSKRSE
jgi:DNA-binding transcriptional ArsR family regulator